MSSLVSLWAMLVTMAFLVVVSLIGRTAFGWQARLEGYSFTKAAFDDDNPAVIVRFIGLFIALVIAFTLGYIPSDASASINVTNGAFALVTGLVAIIASRYINDWLILSGVDNRRAVVEEKNLAVALVEVATYIATAIIFGYGISDPSHSLWFNIAWFLIGQAILVGISYLYRFIYPAIFEQVGKGNVACALTFAGVLLSAGLAVGVAIHGESAGWMSDLPKVLFALAIWGVLMCVANYASNWIVVGRDRLQAEVTTDKNWAIGLLQAFVYVGFTAAFVGIHG